MCSDRPDRRRVLILGGTTEGRELAARLDATRSWSVITSLAGRTREPAVIAGDVRLGGFGGAEGLARFMRDAAIAVLVDCTHPFAARMSLQARDAARLVGIRYFRLERPPWQPSEDDAWNSAASVEVAARQLRAGSRALITVGRQEICAFFRRTDVHITARMIEPPEAAVPSHLTLRLERPPFSIDHERAVFATHRIDTLVTKNAGGRAVSAKLRVAAETGADVIMIERPAGQPPADAANVDEMIVLLDANHG